MTKIDLSERFPQMTPIKSAPKLFRVNGCGTGLYGKRDFDEHSGTYIATLCLSLVFIPVLALRAYRVARSMKGGWYFVGREPLSSFAKGWNSLLVALVAAVFVGVKYDAYVSSPAYKAQRQMSQAHQLADGGHLTEAARIYQRLTVAGADQSAEAGVALKDLLDTRCNQAPLSESSGVIAAAAVVSRRSSALGRRDVADRGMALVASRGDAEPKAGITLLDAIRPLVMDTRPVDARRLALLRRWADLEPTNMDAVVPLASVLDQQGKSAEAKKLLLPARDRLGDGEGARVLGTILGREGDYDGAYALLWPYVKSRLDQLHAAEAGSERITQSLWRREVDLLRENKGPADFYEKYKSADKDQQDALVQEYINGRIRNDPQYAGAQEALEREAAVVPVALDLGIVMLQRAQAQSDAAARKAQLESAERVFLAVGGIAGESDAYRLSLGQVYYWLGKQTDGHKLFDDYLNSKRRAVPNLLQVAQKLRELGADTDARTMAEEAFGKGSNAEERYDAAGLRALCFKDVPDQIMWLKRAGTDRPAVKASLAKALGDQAFEEGRDAEAAQQFRTAVGAYAAMPRSAYSLNETALAQYAIFTATGDRSALEKSSDDFQQAVDLAPEDAILLFNAGITLLQGGIADAIGDQIDLRALHESGSPSLLGYLYHDQQGRDALVQRLRTHPGILRAISYLDKVTVLSPKNARSFAALYGIQRFTRNEAALTELAQRAQAAGLDYADQLEHARQFISGTRDQQDRVTLDAAIKRSEAAVSLLRAKGGATLAVALDHWVEQLMNRAMMGGNVDPVQVVALAEEADKACPSSSADWALTSAHLFRASADLRRSEPAFNALVAKYERSVGPVYMMAYIASAPGPFQQRVIQHPEVQLALASIRQQGKRFPDSRSAFEWALLRNADPAEAEAFAGAVRASTLQRLSQSIAIMLNPMNAGEALDTSWTMQILGKPEAGQAALHNVADHGIPVPLQE